MAKGLLVTDIREMSDDDIRSRFRGATQPLEDPLRLRVLRRDIARLNTVLRERALTSSGK
jgi:ribosomal protein L29